MNASVAPSPKAVYWPPLVRPTWQLGEWAGSWLARSMIANGLPACQEWPADGRGPAARAGLDAQTLRACDVAVRDPRTALFCGHVVPVSAIRAERTAVAACPACVRQARIVPAIWRLKDYVACHIHRIPLVHQCPHCDRRLKMAAIAGARCACMRDPLDANAAAMAPSVHWAHHVWRFGQEDLSTVGAVRLAKGIFFTRLLFAVARSRRGRDLKLRDFAPPVHADQWLKSEALESAIELGDAHSFLRTLVHPVHQRAAALMIERTLSAESANPTILSTLPLAGWLETVAPRGHIGPGIGGLSCLLYAARRPGFELLSAAALRFGIAQSVLRSIVGHDDLPEPVSYGGGRAIQLVRTEAAERAHQNLIKTTPWLIGTVTSSWHLPRTLSKRLRRTGWLPCIGRGRSSQVRGKAVGALLQRLRAVACGPIPSGQRALPLTSPHLYRQACAGALSELLTDVEGGVVPVYARHPEADFDELAVPLDVLPRLWRRNALEQNRSAIDDRQFELF